ncbi:MAG: hypothetical protein LAT84_07880 [Balneolia bacterium]|nr:hypothetical protein [Balneolia bacterium]
MSSNLPDLHKQAMALKNKRRMRYDGGRAWIKNGQLHDAVKSASLTVERNPDREAPALKALKPASAPEK